MDPDLLAKLEKVQGHIALAYEFFRHRDEMNAAVHACEPRWSPITDEVAEALNILDAIVLPPDPAPGEA